MARDPGDRYSGMLKMAEDLRACDAVLRERRPPATSLLSYLLLPAEPPQVDEATRLALDIKLQDSPDLEYLRP